MENQAVFKKATFGGFEKQSVLDYIYQMNNTAKETQDGLQAQLEEAVSAKEQLSAAMREMESRLQRLQNDSADTEAQLRGEKKRVEECDTLLAGLREETKKQQEQLRQKEEEISGHVRLNGELIQQNEQLIAHTADLEANAQEVERAAAQIGEALQMGRDEADGMVAAAKTQAETLVSEATQKAEETISQAEQQAKQSIARSEQRAEETISNANRTAEETVSQATRTAEETVQQATQKAEALASEAEQTAETLITNAKHISDEMQSQLAVMKAAADDVRGQLQTTLDTAFAQMDSISTTVANLEQTIGGDSPFPMSPADAQEHDADDLAGKAEPKKENTLSEYFTRTLDFFRSAAED